MPKEITYSENIELFRQFVVDRVNAADKQEHARIFEKYHSQVTNTDMKSEMLKYYNDSTKVGLFTSQEKLLENALMNLYFINYTAITGKEFAERLTSDPNFKKYIVNIESKNLLSGTKMYSSEVATKETKQLREKIEIKEAEIDDLKKNNATIAEKLERVSKALNNIVSNLKSKLGFSDDKIKELIDSPAQGVKMDQSEKLIDEKKKEEQKQSRGQKL